MPRMKIGPPKKFQLTPAQRRYARALLRGKTERQATKATGVQPATVNRWRSDPNWHDMVVKFQFEQLVEDLMPAVRKLVSGSRTNVSLAKLLEILAPLRTATVTRSCVWISSATGCGSGPLFPMHVVQPKPTTW